MAAGSARAMAHSSVDWMVAVKEPSGSLWKANFENRMPITSGSPGINANASVWIDGSDAET